jgi:hypothetical protein
MGRAGSSSVTRGLRSRSAGNPMSDDPGTPTRSPVTPGQQGLELGAGLTNLHAVPPPRGSRQVTPNAAAPLFCGHRGEFQSGST